MSLLYGKSGEPVQIGPLIGRPGGGDIAKSVVKTLEIDFFPAVAHEENISDPGEAAAMEEGLAAPMPLLDETRAVTVPDDPDKVYKHDDDLLIETDVTADALDSPEIADQFSSGSDNAIGGTSTTWLAQTFTTDGIGYTILGVRVMLYRTSTIGTITVAIKAVDVNGHPTGADLVSATIDGSITDAIQTENSGDFYDFMFAAGYVLAPATKYAIVVTVSSGTIYWRYNSSGSYAGGNREHSTNSGGSWTAYTAHDYMFQTIKTEMGDVEPFPTVPAVGDGLYVGNVTQFDTVRLWVNQQGLGSFTITAKYYNGSTWLALTLLGSGDQIFSYKRSGHRWLSFIRPTDWATFTVDGNSLYWVKFEVATYSSLTQMPKIGNVSIGAYS
ncbi:MAG: choice-of-anchor R domain-containing protein [Dehalococcoides mccartyi]|uniref:choice-of-anchor R domain-containing protein n=1 Tax=Dehalococcoides mccartyi TaxID=61435 RepID=UPI0030FB20A7